MDRLVNLLIGFIAVIPGIIMALGFWHMVSELPEVYTMFSRTLGSFVIIAVISFLQSERDIKKMSQLGIAVGFLWTLTAMILELEL